jgi:hypothetical protein
MLATTIRGKLKHFKSLKIPKRKSEAINRRRVDNPLIKRKRTKQQTMIYKTIHRKIDMHITMTLLAGQF